MAIGKNAMSATTRTLGNRPKPNQTMNSGAKMMAGTDWLMTSNGWTARRAVSDDASPRAMSTPASAPATSPTMAMVNVAIR